MLKRISALILALTMLCVTACSDDNSSDTTRADSSSSVSEQTSDSSSDDSSEDSEASSSQTETTTTASETTTTSETTTESKASDDSSVSDKTTTKATADAKTTTTQATAGSKTTTKATTTTSKPTTTTTTTKKTTTTTKATQPATQKTALDLAYEAVVKCNPTRAQLDLITKDLNNYVKSKGFCTKSVLNTGFYPFVKNGTPVFDIDGSTGFGNCGFFEGESQSNAASEYYEGTKTIEQARESYKKEMKNHINYLINSINSLYQSEKKNGAGHTYIEYGVMIYKDVTNPLQRFDLKLKYSNYRCYVMTIGYDFSRDDLN